VTQHKLDLSREYVEYYLTDVKKSLRTQKVKVFMRWEGMSTVGLYYADMVEIGEFTAPAKYTTTNKRNYYPRPANHKNNY